METSRFILLISLGLVSMLLWQAWEEDYGQPLVETPVVAEADVPSVSVPAPVASTANDVPSSPSQPATVPVAVSSAEERFISVDTDVYSAKISTVGGNIVDLALKQYPVDKKKPEEVVHLLSQNTNDFFVVEGGMVGKSALPSHKDVFVAEKTDYQLNGQDSLTVPLVWQDASGVTVTKKYTFSKDSYQILQEYEVSNQSGADWAGSVYTQTKRGKPTDGGSKFIHTYTGAVLSEPESPYEKLSFGDIEDTDLKTDISGGWAAMIQHYFLAALIPGDKNATYRYYTLNPESNRFVIGLVSPAKAISSGGSATFSEKLFIGPKVQERLEATTVKDLVLTVDYGWFWFIAKPLFYVLDMIHDYVNNWGWAIILLTILIKLVFYPLSAAGYRSMANMRRVQPKMMALRDRYKDDKMRLNQAMMELYKTEKINPFGGCFPILIQIPVFIALYWVLLESVEMRQAPFTLWLDNLSVPDPFFILPLIMGATMFIQQKLNPAPMDPVQEKVMSFLPIVFTIFFAFFPSGLVLYWVANNILSIAQQARINHTLEKAGLK